ncbi:hypothetical protein BIW53_12070 [Pseudoalteromonas byunsanensis]|uniref:Uncharacterized protein n=1 Tax=Pseudoalteromonas byunsanensis TaxID=327939 RepID=A0A1S1N451_9GAMM|nr:hypothetical protein BIW53_12070 [Pseudoalteromonas byunsanensis]
MTFKSYCYFAGWLFIAIALYCIYHLFFITIGTSLLEGTPVSVKEAMINFVILAFFGGLGTLLVHFNKS